MLRVSISCIQVSTNGQISVGEPEENFVPRRFPTSKIIIAPYWADADTDLDGGEVRYGVTRDAAKLMRAQTQIADAFPDTPFTPEYLFIATWDGVGYYDRLSLFNDHTLVRGTRENRPVALVSEMGVVGLEIYVHFHFFTSLANPSVLSCGIGQRPCSSI